MRKIERDYYLGISIMVFVRRRRLVRRRRPLRRSRPMRRVIRRNPRISAPKKFVETLNLTDVTSLASAVGQGYNLKLYLAQLTNPAALSNVFDQYAITGVKYMYIPRYTVSYLDADEGAQMPQIFIAENKFDTTSPTGESALLQENNLRIFAANKRWSLYVNKPKAYLSQSDPANATQIQAQTGSRFLQWLPMTEDGQTVDHLTSRLWIQGNNTASNFVMGTIYAKVYYALKEQK